MNTFVELATDAQKQALRSLRDAQDLGIRTAETTLEAFSGADMPSLPTGKQLVEANFAFAGQLLEQQKSFALRMTDLAAETARRFADAAETASAKS